MSSLLGMFAKDVGVKRCRRAKTQQEYPFAIRPQETQAIRNCNGTGALGS